MRQVSKEAERRKDAAMMEHKGYRAAITFDDEAGVFHGEVTGTRDVIIFEGVSVVELRKEFEFSIDEYLRACKTRDRAPDKPYSGKIPLRVPPAVHRAADAAAKAQGKSLNAWISEEVKREIGGQTEEIEGH